MFPDQDPMDQRTSFTATYNRDKADPTLLTTGAHGTGTRIFHRPISGLTEIPVLMQPSQTHTSSTLSRREASRSKNIWEPQQSVDLAALRIY